MVVRAVLVYGPGVRLRLQILLAGSVIAACSTRAPLPPPVSVDREPLRAPAPIVPSPSASAVASTPPEPAGADDALDCSDASIAAARAALAAATSPAQRGAAEERFLRLAPFDPPVRLKLAEEALKRGETAVVMEHCAMLLGENAVTGPALAKAWHLVGKAATLDKDTERARAALSRSAALEPHGPADVALGAQQRCTSIVKPASARETIEIVTGWMGVFDALEPKRMAHEDLPAPTTEAQAKKRACVNGDIQSITEHDVCKGAPPWSITTGHMSSHDEGASVLPLPGNRFAVVTYYTGMGCRGKALAYATLAGDVVQVSRGRLEVRSFGAPVCGVPERELISCDTTDVPSIDLYDATTGQALLGFDETDGDRVAVKAGVARRTNKGCDESFDLRKLPPALRPR